MTTQETILPSLTFHQYASAPIFFHTVAYEYEESEKGSNDLERKLRDGFSSYVTARFHGQRDYAHDLIIKPTKLNVTKGYIRVGSENDIFSAWKSYDQYIFDSNMVLTLKCSGGRNEVNQTVNISKTTKVPGRYNLYERDLHLLGFMEEYIADVDAAMLDALKSQC